jgi:hypothetical protein
LRREVLLWFKLRIVGNHAKHDHGPSMTGEQRVDDPGVRHSRRRAGIALGLVLLGWVLLFVSGFYALGDSEDPAARAHKGTVVLMLLAASGLAAVAGFGTALSACRRSLARALMAALAALPLLVLAMYLLGLRLSR